MMLVQAVQVRYTLFQKMRDQRQEHTIPVQLVPKCYLGFDFGVSWQPVCAMPGAHTANAAMPCSSACFLPRWTDAARVLLPGRDVRRG